MSNLNDEFQQGEFLDDINYSGLFPLGSQSVEQSQQPGSVASFSASQLDRMAVTSLVNIPVPHRVEARRGLLISVFTASNIMSAAAYRSRVGALKFNDPADRLEFMQGILERISLARARLYQDFGFAVRSCTHVVEDGFLWVVLIGVSAMSFSKWHKVFVRLGALDIKTACIQRASNCGTQTSLETIADMFGRLTNVELLVRNEIVCPPEEPEARQGGKKRKTPVTERTKAVSPARGGKAMRAVQFDEPCSSQALLQHVDENPVHDIVSGCLAFLTSKDMPAIEEYHTRILEHAVGDSREGNVGAFLLSQAPLDLFARVVHLRGLVVKLLMRGYGIDGRGSLDSAALACAPGYEDIPSAAQGALQLISQRVDHERNFPVFCLVDMVICRSCSHHPSLP